MNKILVAMVITCTLSIGAYAQEQHETKKVEAPAKDSLAPYQKNLTLPAFNILLSDSVTIFNTYNIPKGKPIALFFFSPDCGHCQRTTMRLTDSMDLLQDIQFYMITPVHSMDEIRKFSDKFHLKDLKNVTVLGRDYEFFFGSFYGVRVVPDVALYDENKKLIKLIQGETNVQAILNAMHPTATN